MNNNNIDNIKSIESKIKQILLSQGVSNSIINDTLNVLSNALSGSHTVVSSIETVSGSVPAGAFSILFMFSDNFLGTVNGVSVKSIPFSITASSGKTLPLIPYTISTGSITIFRMI